MERRDILEEVIHPFIKDLIGVYMKALEKINKFDSVEKRSFTLNLIDNVSEVVLKHLKEGVEPEVIFKSITPEIIDFYLKAYLYDKEDYKGIGNYLK